MLAYLSFVSLYFLFSLLWFSIIQRPLFTFCNIRSNTSGRLSPAVLGRIAAYGARTDAIAAVYLTAVPAVMAAAGAFVPQFDLRLAVRIYSIVMSVAVGIVAGSDTLLYRFWQSKLDASALTYLKAIRGATASVSPLFIAGYAILCTALGLLFYGAAWGATELSLGHARPSVTGLWPSAGMALTFVLTLGVMFAIVRGTGHRPHTPSISFFSTNMFVNHCAVNPLYNFIYSISHAENLSKKFAYTGSDECAARCRELYPVSGVTERRLLRTDRPDILLVIWESLSARHVERMGGQKGVLPQLERLIDPGVLFTEVRAGSIRTDRGLSCLLSGFPSLPDTSIIKYTAKLPHLPALPRSLRRAGYRTEAVHGGDLTFYHMRDYYMASGHDRLREERDFDPSLPKCKWGVHDGPMMDMVADELIANAETPADDRKPVFMTLQTLSSHEDFKVPYDRLPDDRIANAFAYTDECFGRMVDRLRASKAWDNLLIVVTGDHGFYHPGLERSQYPHIPLLMLGGAVKEPAVIPTLMAQTDIAATLLGQLGLPHDDFPFSRDILADTYTRPFAFHSCTGGFIVYDRAGFTDFDLSSRSAIEGADPGRTEIGRLTLQRLCDDLTQR